MKILNHFCVSAVTLVLATAIQAQTVEITPDSTLSLDADGLCMNDCVVEITPIGDQTVVAIIKNGTTLASGFTDAPLPAGVHSDPGPPADDGTGGESEVEDFTGENKEGELGTFYRTTTWYYQDYMLRNVECSVEFVPEPDPPEEEGGGGSGG